MTVLFLVFCQPDQARILRFDWYAMHRNTDGAQKHQRTCNPTRHCFSDNFHFPSNSFCSSAAGSTIWCTPPPFSKIVISLLPPSPWPILGASAKVEAAPRPAIRMAEYCGERGLVASAVTALPGWA